MIRMAGLAMAADVASSTTVPSVVSNRVLCAVLASCARAVGMSAHFEIDDCKCINVECSHAAGDHVPQRLARVLLAQLRDLDAAARHGENGFVMVFESPALSVAQQICKRIAQTVTEIDLGQKRAFAQA